MTVVIPRSDLFSAVGFSPNGYKFTLQSRQELSRQANGVTRGKDFGSAIWVLECSSAPLHHDIALDFEAMLNSLDGVMGGFYAYDLRRPYPKEYADGIFDESGAAIHTLDADGKSMRVDGLPAGFKISRGDYLQFDYGANDTRGLYQVMEAVTADGSGVSPLFEVRPHIRPGAAVNDVVSFKKPSALFTMLPGSIEPQQYDAMHTVIAFRAMQAL